MPLIVTVRNKQPHSNLFATHCSDDVLDTTNVALQISKDPNRDNPRASIHYGTYGSLPIRVKVWRGLPMTPSKEEEFCSELERGIRAWKRVLGHPNVAPFLGLVDGPEWNTLPSLVTAEYSNGNIRQYLRANPQAKANILEMLHSIADALVYMHSLDPPVVHGSIRSSHVLITDTGSAQLIELGIEFLPIADGLSVMGKDFDHTRWMAPELIAPPPELEGAINASTKETDIYAFGMLMFELYGDCNPWPNLSRKVGIIQAIDSGKRPARPSTCAMTDDNDERLADHVWKLIEACWAHEPGKRPTMKKVQRSLHALWLTGSLPLEEAEDLIPPTP